MAENMTIHLKIWRQDGPEEPGQLVAYTVAEANEHMSFLELLDVLNEQLVKEGEEPVEFDNDCREGICGSCGLMVGGVAHGPQSKTAVCQLHMRHFKDGDTIVVEPWRARAFPIIKDLVVDRSAFDRIIAVGGYVSVTTGGAPDANALPISKAETQANLGQDLAKEEARRANKATRRATIVLSFLIDALRTNNVATMTGPHASIEEFLKAAEKGVDGSFDDEPDIAAKVLDTIGLCYTSVGRSDEASESFGRALELTEVAWGAESREYADVLCHFGTNLYHGGRYDEARSYLERASALHARLGGPNYYAASAAKSLATTLRAQGNYEKALRALDAARARRDS